MKLRVAQVTGLPKAVQTEWAAESLKMTVVEEPVGPATKGQLQEL